MAAVDTARKMAGVSVVSMSWGGGEFPGEATSDLHFTTPVGHDGITFVAASGDEGTRGGAEWPPAAPDVLGVGGTTLRIGADGSYLGETAWADGSGGVSRYEFVPSYQRGARLTGLRRTPDVAFDANPNTGVSVYSTDPSRGRGLWQEFGGTSVGAPAWAAIIAIADQGRSLAGMGSLDGQTQTLPLLYGLPSGDFHGLTSGNGVSHGAMKTGLGTPIGPSVVDGLAFGVTSTVPVSFGNWASDRGLIGMWPAPVGVPGVSPVASRGKSQPESEVRTDLRRRGEAHQGVQTAEILACFARLPKDPHELRRPAAVQAASWAPSSST
jgi:hypothetical protein